jgi:hypothetical protein
VAEEALHPLHGAELRVKRARALIGTLQRQQKAWALAHEDFLQAVAVAPNKIELAMGTDNTRLGRMSVTIGEITYNMRAALDYTVWAIAYAANGKPIAGTQFPIESNPAVFASRVTGKNKDGKPVGRYLKGVPADYVQAIRDLQPFAGCKWTKDLRDFSNPDKHRHLSPLRGKIRMQIHSAGLGELHPETDKPSVLLNYDAEMQVFFMDGRDMIDTLKAIHREVVATVAFFKKGFRPL